jgi:hypothetical protein
MAAIKLVLQIVGLLCLFAGILWVGQGTGVIRWPASSFMIDQRGWTVVGAGVAAIGAALVLLGRRTGQR